LPHPLRTHKPPFCPIQEPIPCHPLSCPHASLTPRGLGFPCITRPRQWLPPHDEAATWAKEAARPAVQGLTSSYTQPRSDQLDNQILVACPSRRVPAPRRVFLCRLPTLASSAQQQRRRSPSFSVGSSSPPPSSSDVDYVSSSLVLVNFVDSCIHDLALPFADVLRFPGT
jgi:hypothetical protein